MSNADERSAALRARLATIGISLDEPGAKKPAATSARGANEPPNPNAIRAILRARGAPEQHLEWLIASCPSKAHAKAYNPPPAWAWPLTVRPST